MIASDINPVELKVFLNHIYELKKGVRQMVLYTTKRKYEDFAVKRLINQKINYIIQPVGNDKINLFFGRKECINAIRFLVNQPLNRILFLELCWGMIFVHNANVIATVKYNNLNFT